MGNFKNNGQTWQKKAKGKKVNDHDFLSLGQGIAIPYGAYDVQKNEGFVNVDYFGVNPATIPEQNLPAISEQTLPLNCQKKSAK